MSGAGGSLGAAVARVPGSWAPETVIQPDKKIQFAIPGIDRNQSPPG